MPDEAKHALLDDIDYRAGQICGMCEHFTGRPGAWGNSASTPTVGAMRSTPTSRGARR